MQMKIELDHSLALEGRASHIYKHVCTLWRCGRKLDHHVRVEALDRLTRQFAIRLLSFVQNDERTQQS